MLLTCKRQMEGRVLRGKHCTIIIIIIGIMLTQGNHLRSSFSSSFSQHGSSAYRTYKGLILGYLNISYASFGGLNSLRSALAFFVWSTVSTLGNLRTASFRGTDATTRLLMLTNSVGLEKHRQRGAAMKMAMRCSVSSSTC